MFNFHIDNNTLNRADIKPIYKNIELLIKLKPISILSILLKDFEYCLYNQINGYIDNTLFKTQWGFKKGLNKQYSLIPLIENTEKYG